MKTVFITGVGKGLGLEFFNHFSNKDYFVYGLLRNREQYEHLVSLNKKNTDLILADISEEACIEKIKTAVKDKPIELLINNAGIGGTGMTLESSSAEEIMNLLQVHCLGALRVTQALRENLVKAKAATVVNINSRFGSVSEQYKQTFKNLEVSYSYRIAKAAQNMLTNCLRNELGEKIEFVSLTPGKLMTELAQKDANLSVEEGAKRIIEQWESGNLKSVNGILEVPDELTGW